MRTIAIAFVVLLAAAPAAAQPTAGEDSQHILTVDHYVPNRSTVPAIQGETVQKLDSVAGIPDLQQVGQAVAKRDVRAENFERFPA